MFTVGQQVEVRLWHTDVPPGTPDGMEGNYRTWVGPWLRGVVLDFNKHKYPYVQYKDERGDLQYGYFRPGNVRPV